MNALIRKESVEELCLHRERALELYRRAYESVLEAGKTHGRAVMGKSGSIQGAYFVASRNGYDRGLEDFMAQITRQLDQDMWKGFINGTPLGSLMDKQEREAFEKSLNDNPPPATPDNVWATIERLGSESNHIFRRGLVNAFSALSRDYRSNDGFKIGERTVIAYGVSYDKGCNWFRLPRRETLQDVDRVMHVLDGKPAPGHQEGLCAAIEEAMRQWGYGGRNGPSEVTTSYWRAKFFKNGNLHLWCLRDDLRQRANKIIAEWFGEVIGAGADAKKGTAEPELRPDVVLKEDYFATPAPVIERLLVLAEISAGMKVLEPSAGEGAIAAAIFALGADIVCVELHGHRAAAVQDLFIPCLRGDFLKETPERRFDRVVMNPPFSGNQAIAHVIHAAKFLKPGGRLVAVMPSGAHTRQDKWGEALRRLIQLLNGAHIPLPENSFESAGTKVNTMILTLDMPGGNP